MKSIVTPAYNEEENIEKTINALLELEDIEIIVSDDGSTDKTREIAEKIAKKHGNIRVISSSNQGKGTALKKGFGITRGNVLGFIDADMSAHPNEFPGLFGLLEEFDVVIGSRALPGSVMPIKQPIYRRVMGNFYSILTRVMFNIDIHDFQCGLKVFKRDVWESIDIESDGFIFDTELLVKANRKGFRIKELPITWRNHGVSKVNPITDPIKMFAGLVRLRVKIWR